VKSIAIFAGQATAALVLTEVNGLGNVLNLESDAHMTYDDLEWGFEAQDDNGTVRILG